jgi:hypothetical protein
MNAEETFYRREETGRESRTLPADTYNLAHLLLTHAREGCAFVPIRSMQYLAVLDRDEFIFVDREQRRWVEIAWQHFRPGDRQALDEPVAYEAVYYSDTARETMKRLQGEFLKALQALQGRAPQHASARVIPWKQAPS